ncbi:MAG TPA: DUF4231 domain-containing protein [Micromonosporaceae bacterium]
MVANSLESSESSEFPAEPSYALGIADGSYEWYRRAAIRSRRNHRISAVALQVIAAAIPVSAVIAPTYSAIPAILGSTIVVLSGLRSTFSWQENYLRFSGAREAVEAERRLYHTGAAPYDEPQTRDQALAAMVSKIEQEEMAGWVKVASQRPKQ